MLSTKKTTLHTGTAGELMTWIERLVNALHPNNGVEYWAAAVSDYDKEASPNLRSTDTLPERIDYPAVFVRQGRSEGHILDVGLVERSGQYRRLFWAKVFGARAQSWGMAKTISEALEVVLLDQVQSVIPDLWDKLPKGSWSYRRHTTLTGHYQVIADLTQDGASTVVVQHASGQVIDRQAFERDYQASWYAKDWMTVLELQENVSATCITEQKQAA